MVNKSVDFWREGYQERVEGDLEIPIDMVPLVFSEIADSLGMNDKQRVRFFPITPARQVGTSLILAFYLAGAVTAGARIETLTSSSFQVLDPATGGLWGIHRHEETLTQTPLRSFAYSRYLQGAFGQGALTRNMRFLQVCAAARSASDLVATQLLAGLYWNIDSNKRINQLLGVT
jgi:hypothetical protein